MLTNRFRLLGTSSACPDAPRIHTEPFFPLPPLSNKGWLVGSAFLRRPPQVGALFLRYVKEDGSLPDYPLGWRNLPPSAQAGRFFGKDFSFSSSSVVFPPAPFAPPRLPVPSKGELVVYSCPPLSSRRPPCASKRLSPTTIPFPGHPEFFFFLRAASGHSRNLRSFSFRPKSRSSCASYKRAVLVLLYAVTSKLSLSFYERPLAPPEDFFFLITPRDPCFFPLCGGLLFKGSFDRYLGSLEALPSSVMPGGLVLMTSPLRPPS